MTKKSLPPLLWLRSFEAAGRLGSFKLAADELAVSPSTVSHQIRDLENHLGLPLFTRGAGIRLTEEGRRYLAPIESGFGQLRSASTALDAASGYLKVGAFPFLANEVFTPNLSALKAKLGIERISLHTDTRLEALQCQQRSDRLDVVVCYGATAKFPGLLATKLFDVGLVPILSAKHPAIETIEELLLQPKIRIIGPYDGWGSWSSHFGLNTLAENVVIETDSFHSAALAVERGEGVSLGVLPFMQPWIRQARIQALMSFSCTVSQAAYLVYAPHNKDNPAIPLLHEWLVDILA